MAPTPIRRARSPRRSRRRPGPRRSPGAASLSSPQCAARRPTRRALRIRKSGSRRPACSWLRAMPRLRGSRPRSTAMTGRRGRRAKAMAKARQKASAGPAALFDGGIRALNVGVAEFTLSPRAHGAEVLQLDWRPPAGGDREMGLLLARLEDDPDDPIGSRVAAANAQAVERILAAKPMLVDIGRAADHVKGLGPRHILHAGPPIAWSRMCGPMRGAVIGAILYEGWADAPEAG